MKVKFKISGPLIYLIISILTQSSSSFTLVKPISMCYLMAEESIFECLVLLSVLARALLSLVRQDNLAHFWAKERKLSTMLLEARIPFLKAIVSRFDLEMRLEMEVYSLLTRKLGFQLFRMYARFPYSSLAFLYSNQNDFPNKHDYIVGTYSLNETRMASLFATKTVSATISQSPC